MRGLAAALAFAVLAGCAAPGASVSPGAPSPTPPAAALSSDAEGAHVRPGLGIDGYVVQNTEPVHGYACTAGFVVRGITNRSLYLATAGHCVGDGEVSVSAGFLGMNPLYELPVLYVSERADSTVDQAAACFTDDARCYNDLALLGLPAQVLPDANASLPSWGGPVQGGARAVAGDALYTVGASRMRAGGTLPDARAGAAIQVGAWSLRAQFTTTTPEGDSGSPVLDAQGHALGLVVGREPNLPDPATGTTFVGLLAPMLQAARTHGWDVEVVPGGAFQGVLP